MKSFSKVTVSVTEHFPENKPASLVVEQSDEQAQPANTRDSLGRTLLIRGSEAPSLPESLKLKSSLCCQTENCSGKQEGLMNPLCL